jgi:hypothetical protein
MQRFTFYIVVALMTFGISSLIAYQFYQKDIKQVLEIKSPSNAKLMPFGNGTNSEKENKEIDQKTVNADKKGQLFCPDKEILPIWAELKKDEDFKYYTDRLYVDVNCEKVLKIVRMDLNNDTEKDFIIKGDSSIFCDLTWNCGFWIYQKNGGQYRKLLFGISYLDDLEKEETPIQIQKSLTKGFLDVLLKEHLSGYETSFSNYKFDGQNYIETGCIVKESDFNGKIKNLSCKEWKR